MKKTKENLLRRWVRGGTDIDASLRASGTEVLPQVKETEPEIHEEAHVLEDIERKEMRLSLVPYRIFSVLFCIVLAGVLVGTMYFMPTFADEKTPADNEVSHHYVEQGRDQTGAVNTVAGMILDYRAFDTLGESFVLFTATCAVMMLMQKHKHQVQPETGFTYQTDPIAVLIAKILIPIIFVLGAYILVNGHLSPGGGFSGGAVLGAGCILYVMTFGEERACRVLSNRVIRTVTIVSLSFYCLAKSYSFFTGNAFNGVESVIGPGTPGDLLSGGLILPLNVAVGLVVCCTMYSFYMLFKRGRLD